MAEDEDAEDEDTDGHGRKATTMNLRSAAFSDHTLIPTQYSHENGDFSPALVWSEVPEGTAELVLACEDPDAPSGTFVHWLLAGIPPEDGGLEAGRQPATAVAGRNGYGATGYGGPHPPAGDDPHRYFFRLYALPEPSGLQAGFTAEDLAPVRDKAIQTATLVGTYGR
jgi:Raf kinase inhibitor-like YbhB/YbcL family protein